MHFYPTKDLLLPRRNRRVMRATLTDMPGSHARRWPYAVQPLAALSGAFTGLTTGTVVCTSAGVFVGPSPVPVGAWYFKCTKTASGVVVVSFTATIRGAASSSDQNGYEINLSAGELVRVRRRTDGSVVATLFATGLNYIAAGTEYEYFIVRSPIGYTEAWIRGGVYGTWTAIGNATDSTYNTAGYFVVDLDAGDALSSIRVYEDAWERLPTDLYPEP